jgi:signal transduction histidine kinase
MSREVLEKACNPFFSTKPVDKGTGLGLSISHNILQDQGGRLLFDSREGEYTKVMVDLPVTGEKSVRVNKKKGVQQ